MSSTLIVGDLHLGKGLKLGRPGIGTAWNGRITDQFKLLNWILEQANDYDVDCLILTGDIFENVTPDYNVMTFFIEWLRSCEYSGVDVHIITGNHDIKRSGSYYTSPLDLIQAVDLTNTTVYNQVSTIYNGTTGFTLFPFRDRISLNCTSATEAFARIKANLEYECQDIPDIYEKVLVGHLALEGSIWVGDEFDDEANELMCPLKTFNGYDFVWMGHVHRPQVCQNEPSYLAHIGSLDLSDFGEVDHKKIIVLFNPDLPNKFKEIEIPTRPLRLLSVSIPSGADNNTTQFVLDELKKLNDKTPIKSSVIKIEVKLESVELENVDRSKIQNAVYNYGAEYLCSFTESRISFAIPQDKKRDLEDSVIGDPFNAIKIWAEEKIDKEDKNMFLQMAQETMRDG